MGRWMVFKLCSNKKGWGEDCTREFKPLNPASSRAAFKKKLFEKKTSWGKKKSSWKITRLPWTFLLGAMKKFIGTFSKLLWKNQNEHFGQSNTMLTFYESMISVWKKMIGDISINSVPSKHVIHSSDSMRKMWLPESFCSSQLMHVCVLVLSRLVAQLRHTLCMFYCSVYKQKRF